MHWTSYSGLLLQLHGASDVLHLSLPDRYCRRKRLSSIHPRESDEARRILHGVSNSLPPAVSGVHLPALVTVVMKVVIKASTPVSLGLESLHPFLNHCVWTCPPFSLKISSLPTLCASCINCFTWKYILIRSLGTHKNTASSGLRSYCMTEIILEFYPVIMWPLVKTL